MKQKKAQKPDISGKRMEAVIRVCSGQMTAKAAAKSLGVSTKTYYEWEKRALQAMAKAMEDKPPGRPGKIPDPEKEEMQQEIRGLKKRLGELETNLAIKDVMSDFAKLMDQTGLTRRAKQKKGR